MTMVSKSEVEMLLNKFPNLYIARSKHHYFAEEGMGAMKYLEQIRQGKPHGKRYH